MANVYASTEQPSVQIGRLGLVTVWVRSDSEREALQHARTIIDSRRYQSVKDISIYLEGPSTLPEAGGSADGGVGAGYLGMMHQAMERGDGLFELWYPEEPNEPRG